MRRFFLLLSFFFACQWVQAQYVYDEVARAPKDSLPILERLHVEQDPRLQKMLKWHIDNNKIRDGIPGYRVEIYFSSSMDALDRARRKKVDFLSKYPGYPVHIKFAAPNFKVRVGDFRTKNEALKLQKMINKDFPGAFIVPDVIDFPLLKTDNYERPD